MKFKAYKHVVFSSVVLGLTLALEASVQAQVTVDLLNGNFDLSTQDQIGSFDTPYDVPGWTDYVTETDAGVQGPGAWWGPYDNYAAWMHSGDAAYTMSTYVIQPGDSFTIDFFAQWWNWTGSEGNWTATLFYDNPANVIGTYTTPNLTSSWTEYSVSTPIATTVASEGGTLGILLQSTGSGIAQVDSIVVQAVPEPSAFALAGLALLTSVVARRKIKA